MRKYIISLLVVNSSGVLSRISGLFSRRGYNIDSLSVGETENPQFSRITVVTRGDDRTISQICSQVEKLVVVEKAIVLNPKTSVMRELALIKVRSDSSTRGEIVSMAEIFRASVIDVSSGALTIEVTGNQGKIKAFIRLMEPFGIVEIVRTGLTAIQRGDVWIKDSGEEPQSQDEDC
jgi:acetolactate synthase-1/3 small subunit